jgi:hypothetical protein
MAVAFIARVQRTTVVPIAAHVTVFQCSPDNAAGYIPLMNCAFYWFVWSLLGALGGSLRHR